MLKSKNLVNTRAVAVIRYSAGILSWTKDEIDMLDGKRENFYHAWTTPPTDKCHSIEHEKKGWRKSTYRHSDCVNGQQISMDH